MSNLFAHVMAVTNQRPTEKELNRPLRRSTFIAHENDGETCIFDMGDTGSFRKNAACLAHSNHEHETETGEKP